MSAKVEHLLVPVVSWDDCENALASTKPSSTHLACCCFFIRITVKSFILTLYVAAQEPEVIVFQHSQATSVVNWKVFFHFTISWMLEEL